MSGGLRGAASPGAQWYHKLSPCRDHVKDSAGDVMNFGQNIYELYSNGHDFFMNFSPK